MAKHDAKTLTEQDQDATPVAALYVVHMLGGQTLIGQVVTLGYQQTMERPYEILVMPSENTQRAQVTLIKFGSMLGLLPDLAVDRIDVSASRILGYKVAPQQLVEHYLAALHRELNPVTKSEVEARLGDGSASSSN